MISRYDKAEMLTALWRLGAGDERLPTSHGILDKALQECLPHLPSALKDGLSFGVTGVGLRCYELPDILLAAQEAMLTSEPNPTYYSSLVTLDESAARQIVVSHDLSTAEARAMGALLHKAVTKMSARNSQEVDRNTAA